MKKRSDCKKRNNKWKSVLSMTSANFKWLHLGYLKNTIHLVVATSGFSNPPCLILFVEKQNSSTQFLSYNQLRRKPKKKTLHRKTFELFQSLKT